jgi:hypothetical protein
LKQKKYTHKKNLNTGKLKRRLILISLLNTAIGLEHGRMNIEYLKKSRNYLHNRDVEIQGTPTALIELKYKTAKSDVLLIITPEHNIFNTRDSEKCTRQGNTTARLISSVQKSRRNMGGDGYNKSANTFKSS